MGRNAGQGELGMGCIIRRGLLDNAPMKLLAIDTGTEALSIAVSVAQADGTQVWSHEGAPVPPHRPPWFLP